MTYAVPASCACAPIFGRTSDILGRRAVYLAVATLFTVATAGCGFSHSIASLLVWRALAGIGAGGLASMASAFRNVGFPYGAHCGILTGQYHSV